ncbi:MAG: transcriptional activator NhaR [Gammaproteobacteria bacterium]
MRHLNYNHVLYFWTVAREGSVARAAEALHLAPQTISGQVKALEQVIGKPLFRRAGRGLALTDAGHIVHQYAEEIFTLGAELTRRMKSDDAGVPATFNVGIVNSIAKLVAREILQPVLALEEHVRLVCREGELEKLLGDLAVSRLDFVLSDRPIPTGLSVRAYNHPLGESEVALFAPVAMVRRYRRRFPHGLDDAPMLLPEHSSALRRRIDDWLEARGVRPRIVAEFDDSALMKAFAAGGAGLFPAPIQLADHLARMYGVRPLGVLEGVIEGYVAISPERRLSHLAARRITDLARARFDAERAPASPCAA